MTDCRKRLGSEGVIPDSTSIEGFEELLEYEEVPLAEGVTWRCLTTRSSDRLHERAVASGPVW